MKIKLTGLMVAGLISPFVSFGGSHNLSYSCSRASNTGIIFLDSFDGSVQNGRYISLDVGTGEVENSVGATVGKLRFNLSDSKLSSQTAASGTFSLRATFLSDNFITKYLKIEKVGSDTVLKINEPLPASLQSKEIKLFVSYHEAGQLNEEKNYSTLTNAKIKVTQPSNASLDGVAQLTVTRDGTDNVIDASENWSVSSGKINSANLVSSNLPEAANLTIVSGNISSGSLDAGSPPSQLGSWDFSTGNTQSNLEMNDGIIKNATLSNIKATSSIDAVCDYTQEFTFTLAQPSVDYQDLTSLSYSAVGGIIREGTIVKTQVGSVTPVWDNQGEVNTVSYSLQGGDAGLFSITNDGKLYLKAGNVTVGEKTVTINATAVNGNSSKSTAATVTIRSANSNARFIKLDDSGKELPDTATDHKCVLDTNSNLIWEVKQPTGRHGFENRYQWLNSSLAPADGPGFSGQDGTFCYDNNNTNDPKTYCNTQAYVVRVNKSSWCGAGNSNATSNRWRLPTKAELGVLHDSSQSEPPYINRDYFPRTAVPTSAVPTVYYWTADNKEFGYAWAWLFSVNLPNANDNVIGAHKGVNNYIRLVRTAE